MKKRKGREKKELDGNGEQEGLLETDIENPMVCDEPVEDIAGFHSSVILDDVEPAGVARLPEGRSLQEAMDIADDDTPPSSRTRSKDPGVAKSDTPPSSRTRSKCSPPNYIPIAPKPTNYTTPTAPTKNKKTPAAGKTQGKRGPYKCHLCGGLKINHRVRGVCDLQLKTKAKAETRTKAKAKAKAKNHNESKKKGRPKYYKCPKCGIPKRNHKIRGICDLDIAQAKEKVKTSYLLYGNSVHHKEDSKGTESVLDDDCLELQTQGEEGQESGNYLEGIQNKEKEKNDTKKGQDDNSDIEKK